MNDQKNIIPINNYSPSISTLSFDEDIIKEEIERLKQQKIALLLEMKNFIKKFEKKRRRKRN